MAIQKTIGLPGQGMKLIPLPRGFAAETRSHAEAVIESLRHGCRDLAAARAQYVERSIRREYAKAHGFEQRELFA